MTLKEITKEEACLLYDGIDELLEASKNPSHWLNDEVDERMETPKKKLAKELAKYLYQFAF